MASKYKTGLVVTGNADGAVKAVKLTKAQLKALNDTQKKGTSRVKEYASSIRSLTGKLSGYSALMGGAVVTAGIAMVKQQLTQIDALAKTSDKLGITTQALTELRYAAELTGVDSKKLDMALQRMTRRVSEAAQGSGEAKDALKELGLSAQDLNKMSPDQMFKEVADAMKEVDGQSDKVRLAFKLFDSEGVDLVNTLNLGSDGFNEIAHKAEVAGISLTRIDASKIEQANDAITDGGKLFDGFAKQLTVAAAPALKDIASKLFNVAEEHGGMAKIAEKAWGLVLDAVGVVADAMHGWHIILGGLETAFLAWFNFILGGFDNFIRGVSEQLNKIPGINIDYEQSSIATFTRKMKSHFDKDVKEMHALLRKPLPSKSIKQWNEEVTKQSTEAAEQLTGATDKMGKAAEEYGTKLETTAKSTEVLTKKTEKLQKQADPFADAWQEATRRIDSTFAEAWSGAFNSFSDFKDSLLNSFKKMLAEMAHLAITKPIVMNIMGVLGGSFGISGAANATGLSGNPLSLLSSGSGFLSNFGGTNGGGLTGLLNGGLTWLDNGISGLVQGAGNLLTDLGFETLGNSIWDTGANMLSGPTGSGVSAAAPWLSAIGGALSGWNNKGLLGATSGAAGGYFGAQGGAALGSMIMPGIGTAIGAALGGLLGGNLGGRLFGTNWQTKDGGISLGVSNGDFAGQTFEYQTKKKSFFRGTKRRTIYSDLDGDISESLGSLVSDTQDQIKMAFKAIGVDVADDIFDNFSQTAAKLSTKGKTDEEIQAMIENWFAGVANSMTAYAENGGKHAQSMSQSMLNALMSGELSPEDMKELVGNGTGQANKTYDELMAEAAVAYQEANKMADELALQLNKVSESFQSAAVEAQNAFNEIMNAVLGARNTIAGNILTINRTGVNWNEAAYLQNQADILRGKLNGADSKESAGIINNLSNVLTSLYQEQRQQLLGSGLEGPELNKKLIELQQSSVGELNKLDDMLEQMQNEATTNLENTMASLESTYQEETGKLVQQMQENNRVLELVPEKLEALNKMLETSNDNVANVIESTQSAMQALIEQLNESLNNLSDSMDKASQSNPVDVP